MKNAITVIDQSLVEDVDIMLERLMMPSMSEIQQLSQMAKDLIEINAELTKREQKCLAILRGFVDLSADAIRELESELKGDSDE